MSDHQDRAAFGRARFERPNAEGRIALGRLLAAGALLFFILLPSFAEAASTEEDFQAAGAAYAKGDFAGALRGYEALLKERGPSGNLYYNLGNTYLKLGQKGRAILNYERALRLLPSDEDVHADLSYVRSLLDMKQPEEPMSLVERAWQEAVSITSPSGWFWVMTGLFAGFLLALCLALGGPEKFRKNAWWGAVILTLALVGSAVLFSSSLRAELSERLAVVTASSVKVRYSPSFTGAVAFELREGIRARILRRSGDWTQIRLGPSRSGWVESSAVEEV